MKKLRRIKIDRPLLIFWGFMTLLIWDFVKGRRAAQAEHFNSFCSWFADIDSGNNFNHIGNPISDGLVREWIEPDNSQEPNNRTLFFGGKVTTQHCTLLVYLSGEKPSEPFYLWQPPSDNYCPDSIFIKSFNIRGKPIDQLGLEAHSVLCDSNGSELFVRSYWIETYKGDTLCKRWEIIDGSFQQKL